MKEHIFSSIRITLVCLIFFCGLYTILILGLAQLAPAKGKGETVDINGRTRGYKWIGQKFTDDKYFTGRPSAVDYNASASGGSNKGPTNPEYLEQVRERIDSFLIHNPGITVHEIPSELITASGSGQDPDLSPQAVYVQVNRISVIRKITKEKIRELIDEKMQKPLLGIFGTAKVNLLQLNSGLDELK